MLFIMLTSWGSIKTRIACREAESMRWSTVRSGRLVKCFLFAGEPERPWRYIYIYIFNINFVYIILFWKFLICLKLFLMKLYKSYINVVCLFMYLKMQHYINSLILIVSFIWVNKNFTNIFCLEIFILKMFVCD